MTTAIPSNGFAPRYRPTHWRVSTASPRTRERRNVLGPDVEIAPAHLSTKPTGACSPTRSSGVIRKSGGKALIGLVGVQSNQFPRAVDLARPFLAAGLPVCIGGFHISGCIAMLPEMPRGHARGAGDSAFRSSPAKPKTAGSIRCCATPAAGKLAPLYNYHERSAGARRRAGADPAARHRAPYHRDRCRASISGAAAPINARSAPSSTCRGARAASARPTISSASCARTTRRASSGFSSPTTISPATRLGSRCSTA